MHIDFLSLKDKFIVSLDIFFCWKVLLSKNIPLCLGSDKGERNVWRNGNVEEVSVEEALQMEIIFGQALMDVLVTKGVISEQEVLDRVEEIKQETGFELS